MKTIVVLLNVVLILLSGCALQKNIAAHDDVYANPKEDKVEAAKLAEIQKQQKDAVDKRYRDSLELAKQIQKTKDDINPYYKDREFKYDDYYDYEYATRVKRFNNTINGLSYYDNYYTNSYWYNQNPYNYGVSVYNGYSWWGDSYNTYSYNPSINFYSNLGWGNIPYSGYNGYNPYGNSYAQGFYNGYNQGYNNGWNGYPYGYNTSYGYNPIYGYGAGYGYGQPYSYGYNNPYNNGWNGWGYYNSYDNNSSYTYGPRASHGGSNNGRTTNPGVNNSKDDSYYNKYMSSIVNEQAHIVKFAELPAIKSPTTTNPVKVNPHTGTLNNGGYATPVKDNNPINSSIGNTPTKPVIAGQSSTIIPAKNNGSIKTQEQIPTQENPVIVKEPKQFKQEIHQVETPVKQYNNSNINNNGGSNKTQPVNQGGSRPR